MDSQQIHYTELAVVLSMSEGAVWVVAHRLRKRYRHLLISEISRTLSREGNLEEEMQALFAAMWSL